VGWVCSEDRCWLRGSWVGKYKHIVSFDYVENGNLDKKKVLYRHCVTLSAAVFVSNNFRPNIYFASFSRDGSTNAYKSAGKVQIKTVPIKIDEKFVVKSEEIPIRVCRVVHTFGETRRRTNDQRDLTRPFLLGCERFWTFTGLSSVPLLFLTHIRPLQTKRRLLYLKTQFVPLCKHFSSRL